MSVIPAQADPSADPPTVIPAHPDPSAYPPTVIPAQAGIQKRRTCCASGGLLLQATPTEASR